LSEELPLPCYVNWNREGLIWNVRPEKAATGETRQCEATDHETGSRCTRTDATFYHLAGKPAGLQDRWFCERHGAIGKIERLVQTAQYRKIHGEGKLELVTDGPRQLGYLKLLSGRFYGAK